MASNYALRTNPVTGDRYFVDLTTGNRVTDPVIISQLEDQVAECCDSPCPTPPSANLIPIERCIQITATGDYESAIVLFDSGTGADAYARLDDGTIVAVGDYTYAAEGYCAGAPSATDDNVLDVTNPGIISMVDVTTNDLVCPGEGDVTSWILIPGSEVNVIVTDNGIAGDGTFSVQPIAGGDWEFQYEIYCNGVPSGETAIVHGTAQQATTIVDCDVPLESECISPPTFTVNSEISDNGVVAVYSVTRNYDGQDFVVRLTELSGDVTYSRVQSSIRISVPANSTAQVQWEWFESDGITPVVGNFTAGFEIGSLDRPGTIDSLTLTNADFCGIDAGTAVTVTNNGLTTLVAGQGGGGGTEGFVHTAFAASSTVISYSAGNGGRNYDHDFSAAFELLDFIVLNLEANSTTVSDPSQLIYTVVSTTNGSFNQTIFSQEDINDGLIIFSIDSGLNNGDLIEYELQLSDGQGGFDTCTFSLAYTGPVTPFAIDDIVPSENLGVTVNVDVTGNDVECFGASTTWVLVPGSEVNAVVTDLALGSFDVDPIAGGPWSFQYQLYCDGAPSGQIATVSGVATVPCAPTAEFVGGHGDASDIDYLYDGIRSAADMGDVLPQQSYATRFHQNSEFRIDFSPCGPIPAGTTVRVYWTNFEQANNPQPIATMGLDLFMFTTPDTIASLNWHTVESSPIEAIPSGDQFFDFVINQPTEYIIISPLTEYGANGGIQEDVGADPWIYEVEFNGNTNTGGGFTL